MAEWQNRPLDAVYPVIFIDAIHVKIRDGAVANRPIYVALAVTVEGRRDILGLWAGDGGEGAKHWMHILTEIKNRGVNDVLMLVCDGLKGLPDAVEAVWPAPPSRPAWSTYCGTPSVMPPVRTGTRSRVSSSPSTPRRPKRAALDRFADSPTPGARNTRRSCGSGRTRGRSSPVPVSTPRSPHRLHDERDRVRERAIRRAVKAADTSQRAGRLEVRLHGRHVAGPHRQDKPLDHAMEDRLNAFDITFDGRLSAARQSSTTLVTPLV